MHSLRVLINGQELITTDDQPLEWLSWDLVSSLHEPDYASLSVNGGVKEASGEILHLDWLEVYPLRAGDEVELQILLTAGQSAPVNCTTAEQLEIRREQAKAAEASGELEAAYIGPKLSYRQASSFLLEAPTQASINASTGSTVALLTAGGIWTPFHKPEQWRLRAATIPSSTATEALSSSFWCPINAPVRIKLGT